MDRHISKEWLERVVSRSIARPDHVPDDAIPCPAPEGFALGASLKGHKQAIAVGSGIWWAEDPETSLGSARALRDWLEDDRERRVWMVTPCEEESDPTGVDRQIAELLRSAEDVGRLTFVQLPSDKLEVAPRLTLFGGIANEELYEDTRRAKLLSGLGAGVCFGRHGVEDLGTLWIAKHVQTVLKAPKSDVFATLLDRMVVHRFQAGRPRDIPAVFFGLKGKHISLEIQDPWIGAQPRNRDKLADFLKALCNAKASIEKLKLVWNPRSGHDPIALQRDGLRSAAGTSFSGEVELGPWVPSRGQHFHDRVVHILIAETGEKWRVDVTSGIDNLMSDPKEGSRFIEKS